MGHEVIFLEHYGWPNSCYDPERHEMTADPGYGISYMQKIFRHFGLEQNWCYLAEDGIAYGISRQCLTQFCRECDIYFNLSNINWIPELELCRRRVLVDTDPVFTQIGAHGLGGPYSRYHTLFTYGENIHQPGCDMPTGGVRWFPTRQPVVLDLWPVKAGDQSASFTTVMNWSPFGDQEFEGQVYGQKDRSFDPFFSLPNDTGEPMEMAVHVTDTVRKRLTNGGWRLVDNREITQNPWIYQRYIRNSRAEFSVAKHGYTVTRCGWFSERSAAYLASGRPVVVQDTGFSDWLKRESGVISFNNREEAVAGIEEINRRYEFHCHSAKAIADEYFDSNKVLSRLLEYSMNNMTVISVNSTKDSS
jgi:hypothetical protein